MAHSRKNTTPAATYRWPRYDSFVGNKSLDKVGAIQARLLFQALSRYFLFFLITVVTDSLTRCRPFRVHVVASYAC